MRPPLQGLASGPCGVFDLIRWDADAFAYETDYAGLISQPGSDLTMVGIINLFCAPFDDLDPGDPTTEYTFVFANLVSHGTRVVPVSNVTVYDTGYDQGQFFIYESPRNSPGALTPMPANPPNATVPDNFADGTVILSGELLNFNTTVVVDASGPSGVFRSDFQITGGTLGGRLPNGYPGVLLTGLWCAPVSPDGSMCYVQPGYSAQLNGYVSMYVNDPVTTSTWGALKALYR